MSWWAKLLGLHYLPRTRELLAEAVPPGLTLPSSTLPERDEALFDRARTQWQFGEWSSLADIPEETLGDHPDRVKIALLVGSAHAQLGGGDKAKQWFHKAKEWGCSSHLMARALIAGAENSLGRASALVGDSKRALGHFEGAIRAGMPSCDVALVSRVRAEFQVHQLVPAGALQIIREEGGLLALGINMPTLAHSENEARVKQLLKQNSAKLRKDIESTLKKEVLNATRQLESFLNIQSTLNGQAGLPLMHGWPVSPDFAEYLLQLVRGRNYDLIVEFGSGTSTVLIARLLALMHREQGGYRPTRQVAFEHMENYLQRTNELLVGAGVQSSVDLHLTPLVTIDAINGDSYLYYDCEEILRGLTKELESTELRVLALVDGPPSSTGPHARYPALDLLMRHLPPCHLDVLLDDYSRDEEREITLMWGSDLDALAISYSMSVLRMEKGGCLLSLTTARPH
jgi:hypothetical protein